MFMVCANSIGTTKKPFNSLLGETYEYTEKEGNLKCLVEQVRHHPPTSAYHIESDDFVAEGFFRMKTDFSLKGLWVFTIGDCRFKLKKSGHEFVLSRPEVSVHNYIVGKMYIWF